jgi:hypothetical protein
LNSSSEQRGKSGKMPRHGVCHSPGATNPGFGGRFAYEFTDWISAEAEVTNSTTHNFSPRVGLGFRF